MKKKEPPKDANGQAHDSGSSLPVGPAGTLDKLPEVEKK